MKIDRPIARKARIEMIPLIDCMFIVLVFFIYAMLSMSVHRGIDVQLPRVGAPKVDHAQPLMISVKADGRITVDKQPVALNELKQVLVQRLAQDASTGQDKPRAVLINADRAATQAMVTPVYQRVSQAGIERMMILTETDQAK